jgi:hypothetical protein
MSNGRYSILIFAAVKCPAQRVGRIGDPAAATAMAMARRDLARPPESPLAQISRNDTMRRCASSHNTMRTH